MDTSELPVIHLHRIGLKGEANRLLPEETEELPQDLIEYWNGSECLQCGAVRWVLPRPGRDIRKDSTGSALSHRLTPGRCLAADCVRARTLSFRRAGAV